MKIAIEDFGGQVARVWNGLRPTTRSLLERALQQVASAPPSAPRAGIFEDARAEWELSRLLAALDERRAEAASAALSVEQSSELRRMAETCATVLRDGAQSAEVFAQLFERALRSRDYARIDALSDTLGARLAPSEICELGRHTNVAVRALAHEALAQVPTSILVDLLNDPIDADLARQALELQAADYGLEEARWIVGALNRLDVLEED